MFEQEEDLDYCSHPIFNMNECGIYVINDQSFINLNHIYNFLSFLGLGLLNKKYYQYIMKNIETFYYHNTFLYINLYYDRDSSVYISINTLDLEKYFNTPFDQFTYDTLLDLDELNNHLKSICIHICGFNKKDKPKYKNKYTDIMDVYYNLYVYKKRGYLLLDDDKDGRLVEFIKCLNILFNVNIVKNE